ncbi:class I tRNA ligase family protein [Sorangium sp. So ce1128]
MMTIFQSGSKSSGSYLFVPEMPTPNGRLHLGHMSGPYLRSDILARFLRSRGAEAHVVSGSDVYESHVELKSAQTNETIADVCNKYHRQIKGELDALDIDCALYVNPLDPEIGPDYVAWNRRTLDELRARGSAVRAPERVRYSPGRQRYIAGCWLSGRCPSCGTRSGSYLCEECGTQYDPQDVLDVAVPADLGAVEEIAVDSWFLTIRKREELWRHIAKMGIEPDFVRIVERYFAERGDRVRLTNPGRWGMTYDSPEQVIFTYTALFSFSVFCGELLAKRRGWEMNPFAHGSGCTTVAAFGIDNAIPYLVGVLGSAIELGTVRPFDHYLTNHFYQLEGRKFSTSRRHLVCARDLVEAGASVDALRYFLAKVNPEKGKRSFLPAAFIEFQNRYCHELGLRIDGALRDASRGAVGPIPTALAGQLEELYRAQAIDLGFPTPNLERAAMTLDTWNLVGATLGLGGSAGRAAADQTATQAYWWLKGLALLACPFMPGVSQEVWQRLGHAGEPRPLSFGETTRPAPHAAPWAPFGVVAGDRIEATISREAAARQ